MESNALVSRIAPTAVGAVKLALIVLIALGAFAQTSATIDKTKTQIAGPFPPGANISFFGSGFPNTASVLLKNEDPAAPNGTRSVAAKVTPDGTGLTFTVPADLVTGRYAASVEDKGMKPSSLPVGTLPIQPSAEAAVKSAAPAGALPSVSPLFKFPDAVAGERLSINGRFTPSATGTLLLKPVGREAAAIATNGSADATGAMFVTTLPSTLATDRYTATMDIDGRQSVAIPGELRVRSSGVKVTGVFPTTGYSQSKSGGFDFDLLGEGFSPVPKLNILSVDGQGDIEFATPADPDAKRLRTDNLLDADQVKNGIACPGYPCLQVISDRKLSVLGYKPSGYHGPIKVRVRVNDSVSDPPGVVTLARVGSGVITFSTLVIVLGLFSIGYGLIRRGIGSYDVAGKRYGPLRAFLLDKETNTYSLSKLQLFAFLLMTALAYVYIFLCRNLVQWNFGLPEVPGNFATLLGVSAGTTVASLAITQTHGNKSSGSVYPSPGDLISDGGVVVPDRFQLLVWTALVFFGYLAVILFQDSASAQFPDIPQGLLYLAGISAATYVGGKMVRDPGPVVTRAKAAKNNDDIAFTVDGANLSKKAKFSIDGAQVNADSNVTGVAQDASTELCTSLTFTVKDAAAYQSGDHVLRFTDPDGRSADVPFTLTPPLVTSVTPTQPGVTPGSLPKGNKQAGLTIVGSNFRDKSVVEWLAPLASQPSAPTITSQSTTQIVVTLDAGANAGSGTITVISPNGVRVAAPVAVS